MILIGKLPQIGNGTRWYVYTMCYIWLCSYFSTFWRRLGITDANVPNLIIMLMLLLASSTVWSGRIRTSDFLLYLTISFAYFVCGVVYPYTEMYLSEYAFTVICCTFPYIFIGNIFNVKNYEGWLSLASWFAVILNLTLFFLKSGNGDESSDESMHRAYALLPSILFLFWQFIENKKLINLFFFLIGLVLISSMGSRGPIVCFLFFAACYLTFFRDYKYPKIARTAIVILSIILINSSQFLAEFMILLLSKIGMSTRIFEKMLNDAFLNYEASSGRDELHRTLLQKLNNDSEGLGYGLFADRITVDWYSHNVFVELWYSFGYYIGSLIIIIFLLLFTTFFIKVKDREKRIFAILLFSVSFVKLQFSASFITDSSLFFLVGYCINGIREARI